MGKLHFLPFLLLGGFTSFCVAQTNNTVQRTAAYNKFLSEYHAHVFAGQKITLKRPDTTVHPYLLVSAHFLQEKIYPDRDALELVQALNPKIKMDNPDTRVLATVKFVVPHYTNPVPAVQRIYDQQYSLESLPDPALNEIFDATCKQFERLIFTMASDSNTRFLGSFWDSLYMVHQFVLPVFNQHSAMINRTQIAYINNEVKTLIQLMQKKKSLKMPAETGERRSFIVRDLINISNSKNWSVARLFSTTGATGGAAAVSRSEHALAEFRQYFHAIAFVGEKPFKCNVYIYKIDANKQTQSGEPVEGNYFFWSGSKAEFGNLFAGCDSTNMGFPRNGNLASTLPVTIGFGSYMFIVKDRISGKLMTKEVSIYTETEFEKNDPGILKVMFLDQ